MAVDRTSKASPAKPIAVPRFLERWWIMDGGLAALRIAVAALLLLHGVREHFGLLLPGGQSWLGAPAFMTDRWIAATLELAGALLLAAGAFTRSTAVALALLVTLSWFAPARVAGHWAFAGSELVFLQASMLLTVAVLGPGLFSLDALREGRRRPRPGSEAVQISPWIKKQYRRRELTR